MYKDWVMWGGFFAINALFFHTTGYFRGYRNGKERGLADAAMAEYQEKSSATIEEFKRVHVRGDFRGSDGRGLSELKFPDGPIFPAGHIPENKPLPNNSVEGADSGRPVQLFAPEKVLKGLHRFEAERGSRIEGRTDAFDEAKKGGSPKDPRVRE